MERRLKLIKNRSDLGAGTRGADMGIDAMEIAAINRGSQFFRQHPFVDLPTSNEAVYQMDVHPFARHIPQVLLQCQRLADAVGETLLKGYFPLVFSGDHSSALGAIAGLKTTFPGERIGVVWIDAHADIHSPYTTPSGNMHGMPIAACLGEDNLSEAINAPSAGTIGDWQKLKGLAGVVPMLLPNDLVYFGVRDTEVQEDRLMESLGIRNYSVASVRKKGIEACLLETLERLKDCRYLYISFDVDSMDSELVSDGTGTPVAKGFTPAEVTGLLKGLMGTEKVSCLEVVEVNPLLDTKGNRMAETAFEVVREIFYSPELDKADS